MNLYDLLQDLRRDLNAGHLSITIVRGTMIITAADGDQNQHTRQHLFVPRDTNTIPYITSVFKKGRHTP